MATTALLSEASRLVGRAKKPPGKTKDISYHICLSSRLSPKANCSLHPASPKTTAHTKAGSSCAVASPDSAATTCGRKKPLGEVDPNKESRPAEGKKGDPAKKTGTIVERFGLLRRRLRTVLRNGPTRIQSLVRKLAECASS